MKIRNTDKLFSLFIRTRDGWTCQRCGTRYPEKSQGLHCSHFHGRRKESVRFDPENADAHCYGCHSFFESNPEDFRAWKLKRLGQARFDALLLRANTPKKRDDKMTALVLKQMLAEL